MIMKPSLIAAFAAAALAIVPASLSAQATQNFNFNYKGSVTSAPTTGAKLSSGEAWPSGSVPLPAYTYDVGSSFEIVFSGLMPVLDTLTPGADGLVRTALLGSASDPALAGARINSVTLNALSGDRQAPGEFAIQDADIIYNPTTREYSLDIREGNFGAVNLPDYVVTEDSPGVFSAKLRTDPDVNGRQGYSKARIVNNELVFDGTDISFGKPDTRVGTTGSLSIAGKLGSLFVGGSTGGGTPDPVPEPATMLIFGGGAAILLRKRAKARK